MGTPPRLAPPALVVATALAATLLLGPAAAAAAPMPVHATLSLVFLGETFGTSGSGSAEVAPDGSIALPAGLLSFSETRPVAGPAPIVQLGVSGPLAPGTFAPGDGPGGGFGAFFVQLQASGSIGFGGPPPLVTIPFPLWLIGNGGTFSFPPNTVSILSTLTGVWTTGTVSKAFLTPSGAATTRVLQGFDTVSAGGARLVQLVTPITVFGDPGSPPDLVLHATLDLRIPEPGAALLLALAGAALVAAASQRPGRRSS